MRKPEEKIVEAARALLDDIKRRHPNEDLRCPYLRALDEAVRDWREAMP